MELPQSPCPCSIGKNTARVREMGGESDAGSAAKALGKTEGEQASEEKRKEEMKKWKEG